MKAFLFALPVFLAFSGFVSHAETKSEVSPEVLRALRTELKAAGFAPVRMSDSGTTAEEQRRVWCTWAKRVLMGPLKEATSSQPWAAEALDFANKSLDAKVPRRIFREPEMELAEMARHLLAVGAEDPVVLWLAADAVAASEPSWINGREIAAKAREAFRKSSYPRILGTLLYLQKAAHLIPAYPDTKPSYEKAAEFLLESLKDDQTWHEEDASIYISLADSEMETAVSNSKNTSLRAIFSPSRFPAWAVETLEGKWDIEIGWNARGDGWASNVKPEGWEEFSKRLASAAAHLKKAHALNPRQPYAASSMITVAMAGGTDESPRYWFDQAISASFDYFPAWHRMAWAMRPRWGGSLRNMLNLGFAAVECGRFDTEAPWFLIQELYEAVDEVGKFDQCRELFTKDTIQMALNAMGEGYYENSGLKAERGQIGWWRALGAWLTKRHDLGAAALTATDGQPMPEKVRIWLSRFQSDEIGMRGELAFDTANAESKWENFRTAFNKYDLDSAEPLLAEVPTSPGAAALLARSKELLRIEKQLDTGAWTSLTADPQLSCWQWLAGNWTGNANGELRLAGEDGRALFVHRARIGPSFEAKGTIFCPDNRSRDFRAGLAVMFVGVAQTLGFWGSPTMEFWHGKFKGSVAGAWYSSNIPTHPFPGDPSKPLNWMCRVKDDRLTFVVNGSTVYKEQSLKNDSTLDRFYSGGSRNARFGFSQWQTPAHIDTVFSGVEIRRIK